MDSDYGALLNTIVGGAMDIGGSLGTSALNAWYANRAAEDSYYYQTQLARQQYGYNLDLMNRSNAFTKEMYEYNMRNRYQMSVQDLKKAGLNPLLAAGGSLTGNAPSSAQASVGLPQMSVHAPQAADMSALGSRAVSAYIAAMSLDTELKQKEAQIIKTKVDTYVDAVKGLGSVVGGAVGATVLNKLIANKQPVKSSAKSVASSVGSSVGGSVLGSKLLGALGVGAQAATAYGAYKLNEHLRKVSPSARKIQDMPNFGSRLR